MLDGAAVCLVGVVELAERGLERAAVEDLALEGGVIRVGGGLAAQIIDIGVGEGRGLLAVGGFGGAVRAAEVDELAAVGDGLAHLPARGGDGNLGLDVEALDQPELQLGQGPVYLEAVQEGGDYGVAGVVALVELERR